MRNADPEDPICQHCGNSTVVCERQGGCDDQRGPPAYCGSWGGLIPECDCWCCELEREGK